MNKNYEIEVALADAKRKLRLAHSWASLTFSNHSYLETEESLALYKKALSELFKAQATVVVLEEPHETK